MANKNQKMISDEMSEVIVDAAERLATTYGAPNVTVSKVLRELGITNRVFYNRFSNIGEVLELVYQRIIMQIRKTVKIEFDPDRDFFEQVISIVEKTLMLSYELKMKFNLFIFENDSAHKENFIWWTTEIAKIINYAKERNLVKKEIDANIMSYGIWCFVKGFNADAVSRDMPKEEAAKFFRYSLGFLMDGIKTTKV